MASISTRTGDAGTTGLGGARRVPKTHPRIDAIGCVDELSAHLGTAKTEPAASEELKNFLHEIQLELITLMGELADKATELPASALARLDEKVKTLEAVVPPFKTWAISGTSPLQARLHVARTVCRRTERVVVSLAEIEPVSENLRRYVNRLSDVLWLLARKEENE